MKFRAAAFVMFALAGCASVTDGGEPDMSGAWAFEVLTGPNSVTHGEMTLVVDGDGYRGTLTTDQGANVLTVRLLQLEGPDMRMLVESPNGPVTFEGILDPTGATFQGAVTYHTGQRFQMSGSRG